MSAAVILLLAAALVAGRSAAQVEADPTADAAGAITTDDLRRHLGVIAHDSMGGRDTPSVGLEKTAQYVADQFEALGLQPAGDPLAGMRAAVQGAALDRLLAEADSFVAVEN